LLLDPLILVGSILHLIVVYYLVRFGILAEIVGLLKIRITLGHEYVDVENGLSQPHLGEENFAPYHQFLQRNAQLRNRQKHQELKEDLVEHIWHFHNARR
ncbi:hypothetical protein PIB30_113207, partial [Stylosanthes scabra]|nr:hypothetical protein [Stylosanthes scabra]